MRIEQPAFLPMSPEELEQLGWQGLDVLLVSGDGYVDHPSFGVALLGRWLVGQGYRVGVVAQPRWDRVDDVARLGRPRLFCGVTAGALDSMLAHYTAFRKKRRDDAYTPGGKAGARPNRATLVYAGLVRQAFKGLPVIVGGIEASLRRGSHYDFWSNKLRRSLLLDSKADLLVYGMAERALVEVARRLDAGEPLIGIPGTAWAGDPGSIPEHAEVIPLPSHEAIADDPRLLVEATLALERQVHQGRAWATQRSGQRTVVLEPPAPLLGTEELDALYALPFARAAHPSYERAIPAEEMIRFSITSHRGCGGGCAFCSLALHQGRTIRSRSAASVVDEAQQLKAHPMWRGSLSDVGGPSANMWQARCTREGGGGTPSRDVDALEGHCAPGSRAASRAGRPEDFERRGCERQSCLTPKLCRHFAVDAEGQLAMLRQLAATEGIKHVRVASGVRHDLALRQPGYLEALLDESFVGGQLKVAPEHITDHVLRLMRKPGRGTFEDFCHRFEDRASPGGKRRYFLVPYLLSALPGCTDDDMRALRRWLERRRWRPQQVQCFIPTPGTLATAMYFAGCDAEGQPIPVARTDAERLRQHHLLIDPPRRR